MPLKQPPPCVNLREHFGKTHRIAFDEWFDPTGKHRDKIDPWAMTLPCSRGTIYPYGGSTLALEVDGRPGIARTLRDMQCCRVLQWGESEKTFLFDVADFDQVAGVVKPKRKRQLTDAQKQELRERIAASVASRRINPT